MKTKLTYNLVGKTLTGFFIARKGNPGRCGGVNAGVACSLLKPGVFYFGG